MGIELPVELRDLAEQAGARWPEADEDAMRRAATAWRDTASSLDVLAGRADGTAQRTLSAIDGETARAVRRHWEGFVDAGSGHLPVSVKGCTAAADRLDHAADQIGAAKVRIVRELVVLAKNRDAAQQAAAAGNPRALAGFDTLVRGASANLAEVHDTLARSVDAGTGVTPQLGAQPPVTGLAGSAAGVATSVGDSASTAVSELAGSVGDSGTGTAAEVAGASGAAAEVADHADSVSETVSGGSAQAERTGPVAADVAAGLGAPGTGSAEAGTGPVPQVDVGPVQPSQGAGGAPAPNTAPQAVHQAWASPPAAGTAIVSGAAVPPAPPAYGQPPYAQASYGQPGTYAAPAPGTVSGAPRGVASPPPAASARPPVPPAHASPPAAGSAAPRAAFRPGPPVGGSVAGPVPPPPAPVPSHGDGSQRPLRQSERSGAVVAFVLHQFPLGHMPVAATRPSLQWSEPRSDDETACLRFPPQDHPRSALVDDGDSLALARTGQGRDGTGRSDQSDPEVVPVELLDAYDPLGDPGHAGAADPSPEDEAGEPEVLSEAQWEQRYVVRGGAQDQRTEYAWPAGSGLPEGCLEPGSPVVLDAEAIVDQVGDPNGRVLSADGTMFARRSLPPPYRERGYRRYRVMRPLPVRRAVSAAWFGQPGGGLRYRTTYPVTELTAMGYLAELVGAGSETEAENAQALTMRIPAGETRLADESPSPGPELADAGNGAPHAEQEAQ